MGASNLGLEALPIRRQAGKWILDLRGVDPAFRLAGRGGRKPERLAFKTKAQAEGAAEEVRRNVEASRHAEIDFTEDHRRIAMRAFEVLADYAPESLVLAAEEYRERVRPGGTVRTVAEVCDEFMRAHEAAGNRALTLARYREMWARVKKDFGAKPVHALNTAELEAWLDVKKTHGVNRRNYRRYLVMLLKFAVDRNYARENTAAKIPKVRITKKLPEILAPHEVARLMTAASEYAGGVMLPFFAIACFAGLRPEEIKRLHWPEIDLEKREIYLRPEVSKIGMDRLVPMPENLVEWLRLIPAKVRHGALHWSRNAFEEVRVSAALKDRWTHDVMRHSAASHWFAKTQNYEATLAAMGHGLQVFLRHYKRAVSQGQGNEYFEIRPANASRVVIPLSATA